MKKSIALLLAALFILSALSFTACSGSEKSDKKEVDEANLSFITVGELKTSGAEYEFVKADKKLADDQIVCRIKAAAEGDLTIPAEYDGKAVVAVIGEAESNEKVTGITLENGVSYIENCLSKSSVKTLSLPATVKGIYDSFNQLTSLTEVSFPSSVKYILNSFSLCAELAKVDTNGYIYGIADSFLETKKLAEVTFNGSIQKMERSFIGCGVSSLSFAENIHDIIDCFNSAPALETVTFDQIAGGAKDSFSEDETLTTVTYQQGGEQILRSYNKNPSLKNVDFGPGVGNISESFEDCPNYTLPEPPAE